MGLESFTSVIKPVRPTAITDLIGTLLGVGFVEQPVSSDHATTPIDTDESGRYFEYDDGIQIIEALLTPARSNKTQLGRGSFRFAICQPDSAAQIFFSVIQSVLSRHAVAVVEGQVQYDAEGFNRFVKDSSESIERVRLAWQRIFPDLHPLRMRVNDAWGYFLQKHPRLL